MIVVDTNTIAYLYFPTTETPNVERLLERDSTWVAPQLWRSEFRNILALFVRKEIVDFHSACQIQRQAEQLMVGNEYEVDSLSVLAATQQSSCSAYDCEFAVLAQRLGTKLITFDKKLLTAFPDFALRAEQFLANGEL